MPYSSEAKAKWNAERENSPEQAELRDEHENGRKNIRIPAPKEPEVNPEVWRDVLPLLQRGFLMQSAEINGILFVFKSLNHHEYEMVQLVGGLRSDRQPMQRFWDIFLAYGVFAPLAKNLDQVNAAEGYFFNALRAGLVAFGNGAAPVTAVEFARRNIPSPERPGSQELEEVVRQIKPR